MVIDNHAGAGSKIYDGLRSFALEVLEAKKGAMMEDNSALIMLRVLADYIKANKNNEEGFYSINTLVAVLQLSTEESLQWLSGPKCHRPGRWVSNELRKMGIIKGKAIQRKIDGRNEKGCMLKLEDIEKRIRNYEL
jgi:hypothetical protein